MANNNRNSSSSSFSSQNRGSNNNSSFKSNTQSTFDMFNINVKDAQKKVTAVFDFTKGKIKDNEKSSIKSINKIFNELDSRVKNSAGLIENSFGRAFATINTITTEHVDNYSKAMGKSVDNIVRNTRNKYKSLYSDLDKQHEAYSRRVQNRERNNGRGTGSGGSSGGSNSSSKVNIRQQYNDNLKNQKGFSFNVQGIADAFKQSVGNDLEKSLSKAEKYYAKKIKSGDLSTEDAQRLFNEYATTSSAARKAEGKNNAIEIGTIVAGALMDVVKLFTGMFTDGAKKFSSQYESSYNQLATAFNSDRDGIYNMLESGMNTLGKDMKGVVNYSEDFIPALEAVSKQGLTGDNALAKAITDSVDKKIMPWLDTSSEQWVNMNTYLSEGNLNTLKGQQLMLQKTEAGNRLIQSGVINSMTNDMEPLLRNIDFNTGGAANMSEESQTLMASLVENGGMTPQEAYEQVKSAVDVQKNQYAAITSGDTSQILMAQEAMNGGGLIDMMQNSQARVAGMSGDTGSDFGASAVGSILGLKSSAYTVENMKAMEYSLSDKALSDMEEAIKSGSKDPATEYADALKNSEDKVTTTQEHLNEIENTSAETLGLWSTQVPLFWTFAGTVTSLLSKLASWGLDKLLNKGLKNTFSKGLKDVFSKGGLKKVGTKIASGAEGLVKGASKVLSSPAARVAGGVAGALMVAKDAYGGSKKSKEWLGSNKTGDKVASGIGGALGGTGPGIGEGAKAGDVAKNVLGNAAKGAAIGTAIGGPIGTVIGGAVGGIASAIGGKRIAKGVKAIGSAAKKAGKAIGGAVSKGAKAIGGVFKKTSAGKAISGIADTWKDDSKSIGQKITGSVSVLVKNNPLVKMGTKLGGALKKGAKSLLNVAKDTKIGKAVTDTIDGVKDKIKDSAIGKATGKVSKGAKKVWNTVKGWFASGSDEIPYDGYTATLHKGETVFNAKATKAIKKILGITGKSVGESPLLAKLDSIRKAAAKTRVGNTITNMFSSVIGKVKTKIDGSHASGLDEVPKDNYTATLHKGEMITSGDASKVISALGITAKSVDSSSTILDKIKGKNSKLINSNSSEDNFNDEDIINAIGEAADKIVRAISNDNSSKSNVISKLQQVIGKVKVNYDNSIVKMEPIDESN